MSPQVLPTTTHYLFASLSSNLKNRAFDKFLSHSCDFRNKATPRPWGLTNSMAVRSLPRFQGPQRDVSKSHSPAQPGKHSESDMMLPEPRSNNVQRVIKRKAGLGKYVQLVSRDGSRGGGGRQRDRDRCSAGLGTALPEPRSAATGLASEQRARPPDPSPPSYLR